MTYRVQSEMIFEEDVAALPPIWLHEKLMEGSVSLEQMDRIAAALPDADRSVA